MATGTKFQQFTENLGKGVHDFTSDATCTLTVALMNSAPDAAADAVLADITEISYTNLSSRVVTGVTSEHTAGVTTVTANDLTLTASGGAVAAFRYIVFYDDDPAGDPLIAYYDNGSSITLLNGETFLLNFSTGLFTIT